MEEFRFRIQLWNNDKCRCKCKKAHVYKKYQVWNPAVSNCENGKYLSSILNDSAIICDEVIGSYTEEIKTIPTNFNEKKASYETQNVYIFFSFILTIVVLLIAVSIH